jgi:hypothetical protein
MTTIRLLRLILLSLLALPLITAVKVQQSKEHKDAFRELDEDYGVIHVFYKGDARKQSSPSPPVPFNKPPLAPLQGGQRQKQR